MTRTGLSPRLASHLPEPFVEIHPDDTARAALADDDFASVTTSHGACVLKVRVSEGQQRGSLFVPIHWSEANASSARIGELVTPTTDPFSGQPESKATPASIARVDFRFAGFLLSKNPMSLPDHTWWARSSADGGDGILFACNDGPDRWRSWINHRIPPGVSLSEYLDEPRGTYRAAGFADGRLAFCLFVGAASRRPQWDVAKALLAAETLEERQRRILLSGHSADGIADAGPVVCACFGVGLSTIRNALASGKATDVASIGKTLRAGTNCGSCLPELKKIVAQGGHRDQHVRQDSLAL